MIHGNSTEESGREFTSEGGSTVFKKGSKHETINLFKSPQINKTVV